MATGTVVDVVVVVDVVAVVAVVAVLRALVAKAVHPFIGLYSITICMLKYKKAFIFIFIFYV